VFLPKRLTMLIFKRANAPAAAARAPCACVRRLHPLTSSQW
jgi:hypothetical protein